MKAVILAGGGGTRLYPLSTPERPKQFLDLVSDKTMIEETLDRIDFLTPEDIYIAINKDHLSLVHEILPQIPENNIIIEPDLRDTASCIGFAATIIEKRHPGEVMAIIYADHLINNKEEFQNCLHVAEELSKEGFLNIVEVTANYPETNYGYVKLGEPYKKFEQPPSAASQDDSASENNSSSPLPPIETFILDSFKEKPDLETAEKFLADGSYLWNTGIYVWKASTLLDHYAALKPETYSKLEKMAEAYDTPEQEQVVQSIYPTLEKISIDFAIMERVDPSEVRIIKADLGWTDIGNFESLYKELESRGHHDKIEKFKKIQERENQ